MRMIYRENVGHTVEDQHVEPLIATGFTMKPNGPVTQTVIPNDAMIEALLEVKPIAKPSRKSRAKKKLED